MVPEPPNVIEGFYLTLDAEILSEMLETYTLERRDEAPPAWALRVLVEGGVPHEIVLDYFDQIKDSGVRITP